MVSQTCDWFSCKCIYLDKIIKGHNWKLWLDLTKQLSTLFRNLAKLQSHDFCFEEWFRFQQSKSRNCLWYCSNSIHLLQRWVSDNTELLQVWTEPVAWTTWVGLISSRHLVWNLQLFTFGAPTGVVTLIDRLQARQEDLLSRGENKI